MLYYACEHTSLCYRISVIFANQNRFRSPRYTVKLLV
jgi:hypothetical protein